jgi:hypothetical protein
MGLINFVVCIVFVVSISLYIFFDFDIFFRLVRLLFFLFRSFQAVAISGCGNFSVLGSDDGHVYLYAMQSGLFRHR